MVNLDLPQMHEYISNIWAVVTLRINRSPLPHLGSNALSYAVHAGGWTLISQARAAPSINPEATTLCQASKTCINLRPHDALM